MEDERNDMETRILAVHAVTSVLRDSKRTISERARSEAANSIRGLLSKPQPPVLHAFARAWEGALSEKTDTAANTH
jgi:hypothetical protein